MQVTLKPGKYVVAVSGGVDSMVLLDLLKKRPGLKLTVAHFDHGIREDSHLDRRLVQERSQNHNLPFVHKQGELGIKTSEDKARRARYEFLHAVKDATNAKAIITAHHQDDLIETAILNLLRGTGRRGLGSLRSTDGIIRPLLHYPKERIIDYAHANRLRWRDDPSNADLKYRRNFVRHKILPKLSSGHQAQLKILLEEIAVLNQELDGRITNMLHLQPSLTKIDREWFINLPYKVANETLYHWLTRHKIQNINQRMIERLTIAIKTARNNSLHDIDKNHRIKLSARNFELV